MLGPCTCDMKRVITIFINYQESKQNKMINDEMIKLSLDVILNGLLNHFPD